MKRSIILALLTLLWILPNQAQENPENACPFSQNRVYQIDCLLLEVPLDHSNPEGETIQLAVAIVRSNNPNKLPDPVLYLEGGPGGTPVINAPRLVLQYPFLARSLLNRDIILVDQRGVGFSQPSLYCTPFRSLEEAFTSDFQTLFIERMPACVEQFELQGIAWQYFTTEQNALDMATVIETLGYVQVNIQGTSFGTNLALILMREHPELIRSAVLDSVLSPATQSFEDSAAAYDASLTQLDAYCDADWLCSVSYPNLRQSFITSFERLQSSSDSFDYNGLTITVTASSFSERVRYMLANPESARLVPAFIIGVENQDYEVIEDFVESVFTIASDITMLPNQALYMTMVCPQGVSNSSLAAIESAQAPFHQAFALGSFHAGNFQMCQVWGDSLPFDNRLPENDVPTLLLSGELDPLTPSSWAAEAASHLSNSQALIFPNLSHEVLRDACAQDIALAFLENPHNPIDSSCLSEIAPISFILHTTVTRTPITIAALALSTVAAVSLAMMLFAGLRGFGRTAWWAAFRKQGYFPLLSLGIMILLVLTKATILPEEFVQVGIVQAILPVLMALQASAVFAADDEPMLEVQIAAPRSMIWLFAERILVVVLTYSLIAIVGLCLTLALEPVDHLPVLLFGWLPPALFLSGMGAYVSIRSRISVLGVILMGFLWFMFALFAPMFLPGQNFPAPLHIIQPYLWSFHLHASLQDLSLQDFWLNRLFLTGAGISFMLLAALQLRDSENLILGAKSKPTKAKAEEDTVNHRLKPSFSLQAVTVKLNPLMQIWGILRYEFIIRWRSRGLMVFMLTPLVMYLIFVPLGAMEDLFGTSIPLDLYSPEQLALRQGELIASLLGTLLFVPTIFLYPILAADNLPRDKNLHVDELISAIPLADWTLLLGRVLGAVVAAVSALALTSVLLAIFSWIFLGAYDISASVDLFVGLSLGMSILTAISVLLGASQSSVRKAFGLVIAMLILPEFLTILGSYISKAQFIIIYTFAGFSAGGLFPPKPHQWVFLKPDFLDLLAQNLIFLAIIAVLVYVWRKFQAKQQ